MQTGFRKALAGYGIVILAFVALLLFLGLLMVAMKLISG